VSGGESKIDVGARGGPDVQVLAAAEGPGVQVNPRKFRRLKLPRAEGLRSSAREPMAKLMALAVVTGANRGIGLALAELLKQRELSVLAACRTSSPELEALGVQIEAGIDVTDDRGIETLLAAVGAREINLLINNAGILERSGSLAELDVASIRRQFEVNALGPLRVTAALRPRLGHGAKVGLITSRMGSIDDNGSGGAYGYRMSKAALNMAGKSLAVDLKPAGVAVAILHPGMVRTAMTGSHGQVTPLDAARGLLARLDELTLETSGGFWHANGERLPW
jgi:NAD(P)-dependent dehydrogenase (short-subunit alcohol dehydrogenase family)